MKTNINHASDNPIALQTDRLYLRPLQTADFSSLCVLDTDLDVRRYFPEGALNITQIQKALDRYITEWKILGFGMFGVFDKASHRLIGRGGFAKRPTEGDIEFGYLFLKPYWGQGLATEAANALLDWGIKHIPTDRIIAFARIDHVESRRVLEKCGMTYFKTDTYRDRDWDFYEKRTEWAPLIP